MGETIKVSAGLKADEKPSNSNKFGVYGVFFFCFVVCLWFLLLLVGWGFCVCWFGFTVVCFSFLSFKT